MVLALPRPLEHARGRLAAPGGTGAEAEREKGGARRGRRHMARR